MLTCFVIVGWSILSARLFQIQVLDNELYTNIGYSQGKAKEILSASRGNIFDRNNVSLTRNISHITLCGNPLNFIDKKNIAQKISNCTKRPADNYINKMESNNTFVFLERNIPESECRELTSLANYGVVVKKKYYRNYPYDIVGGQIIGFTDPDNVGISGIERQFNKSLTGKAGWIIKKKSGTGKLKKEISYPTTSPQNGHNVQLTIDIEYQSILENELLEQKNITGAKSATGIIMNPETGEILAMASVPGFDPNHPGDYSVENQKIKAIVDQFEPGSTFKIVSASTALDKNISDVNDDFFCGNGSIDYNGRKIRDHESYGVLTFSSVIENSSNVGIIKITELLTVPSFYQYIKRYGFGAKTDIRLPGESAGFLRKPENWSKTSPGMIAMGQELSVTALQIATAYSSVANGGYLLRPKIIKQIMDSTGKIKNVNETSVVRRVASIQTMENLKNILVKTVKSGTAHAAQIPGWSIAGKTGTAEKFINGKYSKTKFVSNFAGFFPSEKPQILAVILLDEPNYGYHWGSEGAAPAFKRIIQRLINMDDSLQKEQIPKKKIQAKQTWAGHIGKDDKKNINPVPFIYTSSYVNSEECIVPDVRRMSLLKAVRELKASGLDYSFNGSGIVSWQSPKPNKIISCGTTCILELN